MRPDDTSHMRLAPASSTRDSYERTNVRTNDPTPVSITPCVTQRGGVAENDGQPFELGPALRFPVLRTGTRDEIPWDVRRAVYRRDGWRCHYCANTWTEAQLELDHMIPWSAGGSDRSHNLRTLCKWCNEARSNYDDRERHKRVLPVTWWCIDCHRIGDEQPWLVNRPLQVRPAPERMEPRDGLTFAYCASCDINGYTEVVL